MPSQIHQDNEKIVTDVGSVNFQLADGEGVLGVEVDSDVSSDDRLVALNGSRLRLIEGSLHIGAHCETVAVKISSFKPVSNGNCEV